MAVALAIFILLLGGAVLTLGRIAVGLGFRAADRNPGSDVTSPRWARGGTTILLLLAAVDVGGLAAVVVAAARGQTALAAGTSFGVMAFVAGIGAGLGTLVAREPLPSVAVAQLLVPCGALVLGAVAIHDLVITRAEGIYLLLLFVISLSLLLRDPRRWWTDSRTAPVAPARPDHADGGSGSSPNPVGSPAQGPVQSATANAPSQNPVVRALEAAPRMALAVGGFALLVVGALLLVDGGVKLAIRASLSAGFTGAALVATVGLAARVGREVLPTAGAARDRLTGFVLATASAFAAGVPGLAAIIRPLQIDSGANLAYLAASALVTVLAAVLLARQRAGRLLGAFMLLGYAGWIVYAYRH